MSERPALKRLSPLSVENGKALAIDALFCWLMSVGVLFALRQLFRFDNPTPLLLLRAMVAVGVIVLLTRRWWLPLAVGGGVLLLLFFSGQFLAVLEFFQGLIDWWTHLFPLSSPYNTPENVELVLWLIAFGVCAMLFLMVRRFPSPLLLFFFAGALFTVIYVSGFRDNRTALFFLLAGGGGLLARRLYTRLCRRADGVTGSRSRVLLGGLALCAAGALLMSALVPADTSGWRNPQLSAQWNRLHGMLRQELSPIRNSLFSLQSSGLLTNPGELGGDLHLSHTPVLQVEAERPTLLKGAVYSRYTGRMWETEPADEFVLPPSLSSSVERRVFSETFGLHLPRDAAGGNPLADDMLYADAQVTLLPGGYSLYVPDRLASLEALNGPDMPLLFNLRSEVFSRSLLPERYQYSLRYAHFDRERDGIAERIAEIESTASDSYDQYYEQAAARYLQLPASLPASVSAMAWEIAGDEPSAYRQMERLEEYLSRTYEYTTTPGDAPQGRDFVEYFLETGRGYCVYFASAMAVMARTLGVPSRFVVGYGLQASGYGWTAYEDTAHAWVECYIRGVGWVTFDPTAGSVYRDPIALGAQGVIPPAGTTTVTPPGGTGTGPSTDASTTAATTSTAPGSSTAPSGTADVPPPGAQGGNGLLWKLLACAAAVLLLAGLVVLRVLRRRHRFELPVLRARLPDAAACADAYYSDILRQLRLLGLSPALGETMRDFGQRAARALPALLQKGGKARAGRQAEPPPAVPLNEALAIVMDWRYGRKAPGETELERLAETHDGLEWLVRRKLGAFRYFLRRRLFG